MTARRPRLLAWSAAVLVAAIAAYWYWSPLLAFHAMAKAAQSRDADAFSQYVDYPKLRESLKGQFGANMAAQLARQDSGGNAFAQFGAAIGAVLGMALADRFIDAMVRPETVMAAMAQAKMPDPAGSNSEPPAATPGRAPQDGSEVKWSIERKGVDRVVARGLRPGEAPDQEPGFVFDRSGFATWKLTEIRLPGGG